MPRAASRKDNAPSAPNFDPAIAFPEAGRLRAAVTGGDWQAISTFFQACENEDERSFGASIVTKSSSAGPFLDRVVEQQPGNYLARTLSAIHLIEQGWAARTNARAKHVSQGQFEVLHEHLRRAERQLIDITALEPGNALAWSSRLTTAMGLQLGQSEARRRYDRLAENHPHHLAGQRRHLQQLCPKWSGSWEQALEFSRECVKSAKPGGSAGILIAEVHLERWLDLGREEAAIKYLKEPKVYQEIVEAAELSVLHPDYRSRFGWISGHSTFAMIFSLVDDHSRAATHFRALGEFASELPWQYLSNPVESFRQRRSRALAKG